MNPGARNRGGSKIDWKRKTREFSLDEVPDTFGARLEALEKQQQDFASTLNEGLDKFRRLARSAWRIQEEERRRLARDLHDGVGQNLTALDHLIARLAAQGADREDSAAARELCQQILQDTRNLSRLLHPPMLDDLGLDATLAWLARTVERSSGLDVDVICGNLPDSVGAEVATLIFRVAQEALSNTVKYANADAASIILKLDQDTLSLQVIDDGEGFDVNAVEGRGLGLAGMRERAELLGGEITIESTPSAGTRLRLTVEMDSAGA